MAYSDSSEFQIPRHIVQKGGVNIETITANKTLTYASATYQIITSNGSGANDMILPAEKDGAVFWVKTKAASAQNLVVKDDGGSSIATLTAGGQSACFVCDGASWDTIFHG